MVSTGQIIAMCIAMLLPLLVAVVFYILIHRRSSKIEAGMPGAIGYGILGFLWQELIYLMLIVILTNFVWLRNLMSNNFALTAVVYGLLCSIFVALGLYWGTYLTNQKQRSLYRSATIGLGFGIGNIGWYILATYSMSLYYSIQINAGTFAKSEELKASILNTSAMSMYMDALRCILLLLIYTGVALLLGKFYLEGNKRAAWGTPILVQFFISFTNALVQEYLPAMAARILFYAVLACMAAVSVWTLLRWLRTGQVVLGRISEKK